MTYTYETFRALLLALRPKVNALRSGALALKDARETVKSVNARIATVRGQVRNGIAQAVAQAFCMSLGPETCRTSISDVFGRLPRPADVSEPLAILYGTSKGEKVTKPHRQARMLAQQWAEGKFTTTVETALKTVRKNATDPRKTLTAHLHNVLRSGDVTAAQARTCLRDAIKALAETRTPVQQALDTVSAQVQKVA